MRGKKMLLGLLAAAGLVGLAGPAGASGPSQPFADQARQAGLTSQQTADLQHRVDGWITKVHGSQVALNKVAFDGGEVTVTLPGETYARDLGAAPQAAVFGCNQGDLCIFPSTSYTGDKVTMYFCRSYPNPYQNVGTGSWVNNQTGGANGAFYTNSGSLWGRTGKALAYQPSAYWAPVHTIIPCGVPG